MASLYGKGTITELVKGKKYRIKFSGGKDPITGKYIQVKETFLGTKRQAELRIEEIRLELKPGKRPNADKVILSDWIEQYLKNRVSAGKVRPATIKQDKTICKHIMCGLGSVRIVDITPAMVNSFYAALRDKGKGDTTILQCHKKLKAILRDAVNNDIIAKNPCDRVETPRKPKPTRQALSTDEAKRLDSIIRSETPTANLTAVYLGLATGARLGEILGLTWHHIALDEVRPFIHYVQQHTKEGNIAPLKTDKDENPQGRIVPVDNSTVEVLMAWKSEQLHMLNELGIEQSNTTPVISNTVGGWSGHANFERWFRSFCITHGFGHLEDEKGRKIVTLTVGEDAALYEGCVIKWVDAHGWPCDETGKRYSRTYKRQAIKAKYKGLVFHALRHTHFTYRLANGMDLPTAQALGGWSTPSVLLNTYAHSVPENVWASAHFMDELTREKAHK